MNRKMDRPLKSLLIFYIIFILVSSFSIETLNTSANSDTGYEEIKMNNTNSKSISRSNSTIIDLNTDTDEQHQNITIYGANEDDWVGWDIISGDINNDLINDIIISTFSSIPQNGEVLIIFGSLIPSPIYDLNYPDVVISGIDTGDGFGYSFAIGDVNNDSKEDLLVSAPYADGFNNLKSSCGEINIFYGNESFPKKWDLTSKPADVTIYGKDTGDLFGYALTTGDIDGDNIDDIIVSAYGGSGPNNLRGIRCGEVYIIYGNDSFPSTINISSYSDILVIYGKETNDFLGYSIATGDINLDEYDDLVISGLGADGINNSLMNSGEVYIIYGNKSNPSSIDFLYNMPDVTIYGNKSGDELGINIEVGDLNVDSMDDLVIGSMSNFGASYGEVYIIYGNKTLPTIINSTNATFKIIPKDPSDKMGYDFAIGDSNGDNIKELMIGAPAGDGLGNIRINGGEIYVINWTTSNPKSIFLSTQQPNITIYGKKGEIQVVDDGDNAGTAVCFSDINGDKIDDIIISAPGANGRNNEKIDSGEIYIIFSKGILKPKPVIYSAKLINGAGENKTICYSECSIPYYFRIKIITANKLEELNSVSLILGYKFANQRPHYVWSRSNNEFSENYDPNDCAEINTSKCEASNDLKKSWTIDFAIVFGWNYPDNNLHSIQVYAAGIGIYNDWLNLTEDIYEVENRVNFTGELEVNGEHQGKLSSGDWVSGNEKITFQGLKIVYSGTDNIFPPESSGISVSLKDSDDNEWIIDYHSGVDILCQIYADNDTKLNKIYDFKITGIPEYCDISNIQFSLKIDADNVEFNNPFPNENVWSTTLRPRCEIELLDLLTGVNISTVDYRISKNDQKDWTEWSSVGIEYDFNDFHNIFCSVKPLFTEGVKNFIQWRAQDIIRNNISISLPTQIKIDISNISFLNPTPSSDKWQINKTVQCGIFIEDDLSGVNASSIEFSTSTTGIWGYGDWQSANKMENNNIINCSVTPTFTEGTDNYIRWRAKDVAENGYHVSDNYQIKIKLNKPPTTTLISPKNRSIIYTLAPELVWSTNDPDNDTAISHSIYLSTDKEQIIDLNKSALLKSNIVNQFFELDTQLEDNTTYYWTIIPFDGKTIGYCTSNFWEFRIQTTVTIPTCTLIEPLNNTNISSTTPKLSWILNYFNSSIVTYNIYLAKAPVVGELISEKYMYQENYKLTTFIVEKTLIRGETYYWTVIPIADHPSGKLEGICRSGQWKFRIELPVEHFYNISMEIESINLSVEQGGIITTNITITNLGDSSDTFFLEINKGTLNANIAFEDSINKINLLKDEQKKITLEIIVSPITTPKNYTIQITAESEKAKLDGKDVSVTKSIRLKVLEKPPEDQPKDKSEKQFGFWDMIMWLVIILTIFILLVISIFVYKAKKEKEIPTVKAELMYKPPPHLALPEGEVKGEEDMLLPGADEEFVPTLGAPGVSTRYQLPKAVLTKKQELKLLREKFLLGDIDKETYKEMKNEIENTEDISAEDQDLDLKGKLPEQTEDIGQEDNEDIEDIEQEGLSSEIENFEIMEQEEFEKTTEIPVEEPVIDSELQDIPEEAYPFPDDGFCITCGQNLDPDMAYCWSCGTKYETLEE